MQRMRSRWRADLLLLVAGLVFGPGCYSMPVAVSAFFRGPAPLRMPGPEADCGNEDARRGGHVFEMYCGFCHNARSLAERPFSDYKNVAQHMRVRANLTSQEYAELMAFLRRWHDVPAAAEREAPSPKRFFFGQPIPELRNQQSSQAPDPVAGPRPGATDEVSTGQPAPGNSPREAR